MRYVLPLLLLLASSPLWGQTYEAVSDVVYPEGVIPSGFTEVDGNATVTLPDGSVVAAYPPGVVAVNGDLFLGTDGRVYQQSDPVLDEVDESGNTPQVVAPVTPGEGSPRTPGSVRDLMSQIADGRFSVPSSVLFGSEPASGGSSGQTAPLVIGTVTSVGSSLGGVTPGVYTGLAYWNRSRVLPGLRAMSGNRQGLLEEGQTSPVNRVTVAGQKFQALVSAEGNTTRAGLREQAAYTFQPRARDSAGANRLASIVELGSSSIPWQVSALQRDRTDAHGAYLGDDFMSTPQWRLFFQSVPFGASSRSEVVRTDGSGYDRGAEGRMSYRSQSRLRAFPLDVFGYVDFAGGVGVGLPSGKQPQFIPAGGVAFGDRFSRRLDTANPVVLTPSMEALFSEAVMLPSALGFSGLASQANYIFGNNGQALTGSRDLAELGGGHRPTGSLTIPGVGHVTTLDLGMIGASMGVPCDVMIAYQGTDPLVIHSGATFGLQPQADGSFVQVRQRVAIISTTAPVFVRGSISYVPSFHGAVGASSGVRIVATEVAFMSNVWGGYW